MPGTRPPHRRGSADTGLIAIRSLVFGLLTISVTALAHTAGGGSVPAVPGLAVLALITSATAWPVLRRGLHPAVLFAAVGAAQIALHPAFQALVAPATHAGHPTTPLMVGAHLTAGLASVALVMAVDPIVRSLGAARPRRRVPAPVMGRRIVPVGHVSPSPTPARVATDAPRRGPPGGRRSRPPLAASGASGRPTSLCRSGVLS